MAERKIRAWVVAETSGSLTPLLLTSLSDMELHDACAKVERTAKAVRRELHKRNEAKRARLAKAGV